MKYLNIFEVVLLLLVFVDDPTWSVEINSLNVMLNIWWKEKKLVCLLLMWNSYIPLIFNCFQFVKSKLITCKHASFSTASWQHAHLPSHTFPPSLYYCINQWTDVMWTISVWLLVGDLFTNQRPRPALLYFCYLYERWMQVVCCEMCLAWSSGPISSSSSSSGLFRTMLFEHLHLYSFW